MFEFTRVSLLDLASAIEQMLKVPVYENTIFWIILVAYAARAFTILYGKKIDKDKSVEIAKIQSESTSIQNEDVTGEVKSETHRDSGAKAISGEDT